MSLCESEISRKWHFCEKVRNGTFEYTKAHQILLEISAGAWTAYFSIPGSTTQVSISLPTTAILSEEEFTDAM